MAYPIEQPYVPFLKLHPLNKTNTFDKNDSTLYDIPYNFIQSFKIDYTEGIGAVTLELFDPTFKDVFLQLANYINKYNGEIMTNFFLQYGYGQGTPKTNKTGFYEKKIILAKDAKGKPVKYKTEMTEKQIRFSRDINVQSRGSIVFFDRVEYEFTNAGIKYVFHGYNSHHAGVSVNKQIDEVYKGNALGILRQVIQKHFGTADIDFGSLNPNVDLNSGIVKTSWRTSNMTISDVIDELLSHIKYKDNTIITWKWWLTTTMDDKRTKIVPQMHCYPTFDGVQETEEFLGEYNFYIGEDSSIIKGVRLVADNLLPLMITSEIGEVDTVQKQSLTNASSTKNSKAGNSRQSGVRGTSSDTEDKEDILKTTDVKAADNPNNSFHGDHVNNAQVDAVAYRNMLNVPFKLNMVTLGDPYLDERHIAGRSFIQFNAFQANGQTNPIFTGVYKVFQVSHSIGAGIFETHMYALKTDIAEEKEYKRNVEGVPN